MEEPGPCLSFCRFLRVKLSASLTLFSGPDLPGSCFKPPKPHQAGLCLSCRAHRRWPRLTLCGPRQHPHLAWVHISLAGSSSLSQGALSPGAGTGGWETSGLWDLKASLEPHRPFSVPTGVVFPLKPRGRAALPHPTGMLG